MRFLGVLIASTFALTTGLGAGSASGQVCDLGANGNFRFLNDEFPQGTQNAEYVARLVVPERLRQLAGKIEFVQSTGAAAMEVRSTVAAAPAASDD